MTVAFPVNVNVQVCVSWSPVEHAPDQTAVRSERLSVTRVPMANEADTELPEDALIPAGLDVTVTCRSVTVTVSVAV